MSSVLTKNITLTALAENEIPYSGFFITTKGNLSLEYAIEILESKKMNDYLHSVGISVNGHSKRLSVKDVENFMF